MASRLSRSHQEPITEMTDFPTLILTSEIPIRSCTCGLNKAPRSGGASSKATVGSTEYSFPTPRPQGCAVNLHNILSCPQPLTTGRNFK